MNIQEAKEEIRRTVLAYTRRDEKGELMIPVRMQRPILLIGPPGIGKTAIMEQVASECGIGLVNYTITHHTRQSAIGLPVIRERSFDGRSFSVTEYTMSEIIASVYDCMERTGKREGILFIDEINCVSETLAPAMLEFLQCKRFGSHAVPEGFMIVAAGNPEGYNKSVRDFDVVTLDRVRYLEVKEDLSVFFDYAAREKIHGAILAFLTVKPQDFYRMEPGEKRMQFVTARGWEDLSRMLYAYEELGLPVTRDFVLEFLQYSMVAGEFADFYRTYRTLEAQDPVSDILAGRAGRKLSDMVSQSSYDEKICLIHMLCEGILTQGMSGSLLKNAHDFILAAMGSRLYEDIFFGRLLKREQFSLAVLSGEDVLLTGICREFENKSKKKEQEVLCEKIYEQLKGAY